MLAPVLAQQAVRVILDDGDAVVSGSIQDYVHLAPDASVVYGHDRPCAGRDELFEVGLVQVERIQTNVAKHWAGAAQHEGIDGGNECKGRDDNLVAGLDLEQQRRHLKRVRARCSEQDLGNPQFLLEKRLAFPRKWPVAGDVAVRYRLGDILLLLTLKTGPIERNLVRHAFLKTKSFWVP